MSYLLTCPNCGVREVTDFGYGGEISARPKSRPTLRELGEYNYFRRNRRRRPARVVVPPLGVPRLVRRRARHADERGAADRVARRARTAVAPHERAAAAEPARRADRPPQGDPVHVRRQGGRGVRGRHRRIGAVRRRPAHVLAKLQVPPPARAAVLRRPVPELHRRGRWRARRARVHRAGPRGDAGRAPERPARPRPRRDARHGHRGDEVHAARLLLQDVHPSAQAVARVREGAATRRRPRRPAQAAARPRVADRVPPPPRRRARHRWRDRGRNAASGRRERRARTSCWSTRGRCRSSRWPASRSSRGRARSATSTGSSPSGRATRSTRSARAATCSPPARSSSRWCSPATTCPG